MRTRLRVTLAVAALATSSLVLSLTARVAVAQDQIESMKEFNAGDLEYRTHVYLEFASRTSPQAVLMPPEGFSGSVFRTRVDGSPGWGKMLQSRGYNAYMLDHVGCGKAITPPSRDLLRITDKGTWGAFQIMVATRAQFVIAQGFSAGFAIKGRSQRDDAGFSFALIDPIGPQGTQDFTRLTPAQLHDRQLHLEDALWREWGFGRRAGSLRSGTDLSAEDAEQLLALYDPHQPNYRMTLLTGLEAGTSVHETMNLRDIPVLIVRTSAADAEQIRRENQFSAWLEEAGCRVDHLDLSTLPTTRHTTGLPWAGDEAEAVLDALLEWHEALGLHPATHGGSR